MTTSHITTAQPDDKELHNVPGPSYQDVLDQDRFPVPAILRDRAPWPEGLSLRIPRERYTSREIYDREVESMWTRVWQFVGREEQFREAGDSLVYRIADREFIVVRGEDGTIRAFPNTCLHRGRVLRECDGRIGALRCPFHGFTWALNGEFKGAPAMWDFDPDCDFRMPEAAVGTWDGMVFINPDPECEPLDHYLADFKPHFERAPFHDWSTRVHAAKILACNWKEAIEAFIEAHHVLATHPQAAMGADPCNSQYDVWPNNARIIMPMGVPSVVLRDRPDEQRTMNGMMGRVSLRNVVDVPEGVKARHLFADIQRGRLRRAGNQHDLCDAEVVDLHTHWLFPNLLILGGPRGMVFRFRPHNGPDHSVVEVLSLAPPTPGKPAPPPAGVDWLEPNQKWTEHPALPDYGLLDQDMSNMSACHDGIRNIPDRPLVLSRYQEIAVAHFHDRLYNHWLAADGS